MTWTKSQRGLVAPSRVRGLKHRLLKRQGTLRRRTLTGAWIETPIVKKARHLEAVAPSRVRGLKPRKNKKTLISRGVAPSRVRGLKRLLASQFSALMRVAPSRVRGLKHAQS